MSERDKAAAAELLAGGDGGHDLVGRLPVLPLPKNVGSLAVRLETLVAPQPTLQKKRRQHLVGSVCEGPR